MIASHYSSRVIEALYRDGGMKIFRSGQTVLNGFKNGHNITNHPLSKSTNHVLKLYQHNGHDKNRISHYIVYYIEKVITDEREYEKPYTPSTFPTN